MTKSTLIIATRESPLALWQANWVKHQLELLYPTIAIQLLGITTKADTLLDISLTTIGGKGWFVKELEEALLDHRADIAVHSMKDVPMDLPKGLCLPVMCERDDPRDAFVSNEIDKIDTLPKGAVIGTSSLRRQSQLSALRPDLTLATLRGNVNTRLAKLDRGDFAAIILATAGLKRLGLQHRIRTILSLDESLPAAGQGILGIECREDDPTVQSLIAPLNHPASAACGTAERAMCRRLGGGCQAPVAAFAELQAGRVELRGLVASVDGKKILRAKGQAPIDKSEALGIQIAEELLQQGAEEILSCLPINH